MTIVPPTTTPMQAPDLPAFPPALLGMLSQHLPSLLTWIDQWQASQHAQRWRGHPLTTLADSLDWPTLDAACAPFHADSGCGAPATYPAAMLLRAEIVRAFWRACSDRQLEDLLANHALVRWFCGLGLGAPTPDHTTLHRFHGWLATHAPDLIFTATLQLIDQHDPLPLHVQLLDTFACHADAADQHPIEVLDGLTRQLRRRLTRIPLADAPPLLAPAPPPLPWDLDREQAETWTPILAADAAHLLATVTCMALPGPQAAAIERARDALAHVLATDFAQHADGAWYEVPHGEKGLFRLSSATDSDAGFRIHGGTRVNGYNVSVLTTEHTIRAIEVAQGCTADSTLVVPTLEQLAERGEAYPEQVVMDRAGGYGSVRVAVGAATDGATQMVARIPPAGHAVGRFGPESFVLSSDEQSCRCPNGVVSTKKYAVARKDGWTFRWTAKDCVGCPLRDLCRDPAANPNGNRQVFVSAYHAAQRLAAAFNATAEGQALLRKRWQVERMIAHMVRCGGARRARCRGRVKVQFQQWMAAMVVNTRSWLGRVQTAQGRSVCPNQPNTK